MAREMELGLGLGLGLDLGPWGAPTGRVSGTPPRMVPRASPGRVTGMVPTASVATGTNPGTDRRHETSCRRGRTGEGRPRTETIQG
jgi:hypothetical protein